MALRYDFSVQTNLGNVADPAQAQDAATKAYVDSRPTGGNVYVDTNGTSTNLALAAGVANIGATSVVVTGDVTALLLPGTVIGIPSDTTVYRTLSSTFALGNTTINITPALVVALAASGQVTYQPITQSQFTDVIAGSNITLTQFGKQLQISAAGGSSTTVSVNGSTVANPNFQNNSAALGLTYSVSGSNITASIRNADVVAVADAEIASLIGSISYATTQALGSATTVIINNVPSLVMSITNTTTQGSTGSGAVSLYNILTGSSVTTNNAAAAAPLSQYAYIGVGNSFSTGYLPVASYAVPGVGNIQIEVTFAAGVTLTQVQNLFSGIASNTVFFGPSTVGQFVFQTPPNNTILGLISANAVSSLNTLKGNLTISPGTGIGIASSGSNITITNTGSGSGIAAANFTSFVNDQYALTSFIGGTTDPYAVYIEQGYQIGGAPYTINSGGYIGSTQYIRTPSSTPPTYGLGLVFPINTTYTDIEVDVWFPGFTMDVTITSGTPTYRVDGVLFAISGLNSSSAPDLNGNEFPPFAVGGSDDDQMVTVVAPTFTQTSLGGNVYRLAVGPSQYRAVSNNYSGLGSTNQYSAYLRIVSQFGGTTVANSIANFSQTSGDGGIRALVALPGVGGATPTIQQTNNIGNTITNTSGNVGTTIWTDNATSRSTTLGGTGVSTPLIQLNGTTSGTLTLQPSGITSSYALTFPSVLGNNAQQLVHAGSGFLGWYWSFQYVAAVATSNIATLTGVGVVVDGYTTVSGDRVLLTNQTTTSQNGIWVVQAGTWSKDVTYQYQQAYAVNGTSNGQKIWARSTGASPEAWNAVTGNNAIPTLDAVLQSGSTSVRTATLGGLTIQNQNVSTPGSLIINGLTTGSVTVKAASSTTSYNLTLPAAQGSAASVLTNDGSGNLTWGTGGGGGGNFPTYAAEYQISGFANPTGTYDTPIRSAISFDDASRTFTIAPASGYTSFDVWNSGNLYTQSVAFDSIQIPNVTGTYNFYYSTSGGTLQLNYNQLYFNFQVQTPIATVYWNANTSSSIIFADERHGLMDWRTHEYLHRTRGAAYATGFTISGSISGTGNAATDAQIGISTGTFYDEDIQWELTGGNTPFSMAILARSLTAWIRYPASAYPYYYNSATQTAGYNLNTAGSWSTAGMPNNSYGVMWVVATNDIYNPFYSIMGQDTYGNLGNAAQASWNDLDLTGLPFVEYRTLYKLIFQTKTSYTNAVHVKQVQFQDWRTNTSVQLPSPSFNAVDTAFRDTPDQVFATDATADAAWTTAIQTRNALLAGASPSTTRFNRVVAASPLYISVDINNVATIGTTSVLSYKASVLGATVANLSATYNNGTAGVGATLTSTTNGVFTVDGVTFTANSRVLIKDQIASVQNGIYTVTTLGTVSTPWVLTRATDMDEPSEFFDAVVIISQGTQNGGDSWVQTSNITVIGTDPVVWTKFAENGTPSLQSVVLTGNSSSNPIYMQSASGAGFQLYQGGSGIDPALISQSNDGSTDVGFNIQTKNVGSFLINSTNVNLAGLKVTPASGKITLLTTNTSGSGLGQDLVLATSPGTTNGNIIFTGGFSTQSVTFRLPTSTSSSYFKADPGIANNTYWNASQFAIGQYTTGTTVDTGKLALVIDASTTNNIGLTVSTPQSTAVNMTLTAGPASSAFVLKTSNSLVTNFLTITPSTSGGSVNFAAADGNILFTPTSGNNVAFTTTGTGPNTVRIFPKLTGFDPTITIASSDTNRGLTITTKGTGSLTFAPDGSGVSSFTITASTSGNNIQVLGTNANLGLVPAGTGAVYVYKADLTTQLGLYAPASTGTSYAKIDANSANAMVLNANTLTVGAQSTGNTVDASTAAFRIDATSSSSITLSVATPQTTAVNLNIVAGPTVSSYINFSNAASGNNFRVTPGSAGGTLTLAATNGLMNHTITGTTTATYFGFASAATPTIRLYPVGPGPVIGSNTVSAIAVQGYTDTSLDLVPSGAGVVRVITPANVNLDALSIIPANGSQNAGITMSGATSALSFDINIKGPLAGAAFNVGSGTGYSKLSMIPNTTSYLLQLNSTTGVTVADLQFRTLGTGSVYKFLSGDGTNSFSMTPPNTTTSYNLFEFGSTEARFNTSASGGFTFGNLVATTGTINTTVVNLRSTATQAIVQSQGVTGSTSYDLVLRAQQSGNVVLGTGGNGISLGNTTAYTTPILAANDVTTPTALNAGTSGQVLTSRGAGATPYWATNATALKGGAWSITSNTNVATGAGSINASSFTQQFNNLGITTATNIWTIPANSGRLKITMYFNMIGSAAYTSYWAFSTSSTISTTANWGAGAVASMIQYNSAGFASSSTGGTPASATILRAYGATDAFSTTAVGFLTNSTSSQSLYLTYYQQSGANITLTPGTMVLIEQVPY